MREAKVPIFTHLRVTERVSRPLSELSNRRIINKRVQPGFISFLGRRPWRFVGKEQPRVDREVSSYARAEESQRDQTSLGCASPGQRGCEWRTPVD